MLGRLLFPGFAKEDKKERFASWAAGILFAALILPFIVTATWSLIILYFAGVLVLISFARSWI